MNKMLKPLAIAAALIATLAPAKADYETGRKAAMENALQALSFTAKKVKPLYDHSDMLIVLFQIENKSDQKYSQVTWDCTLLLGSEPLTQNAIVVQDIPANTRIFHERSFSDPAIKDADPSMFKFECRMTWANDGENW
jgi:hypothetical protein